MDGRQDSMDMIGHDNVCMQVQPFVFLTILKRINDAIKEGNRGEYILPTDNSIRTEVQGIFFVESERFQWLMQLSLRESETLARIASDRPSVGQL